MASTFAQPPSLGLCIDSKIWDPRISPSSFWMCGKTEEEDSDTDEGGARLQLYRGVLENKTCPWKFSGCVSADARQHVDSSSPAAPESPSYTLSHPFSSTASRQDPRVVQNWRSSPSQTIQGPVEPAKQLIRIKREPSIKAANRPSLSDTPAYARYYSGGEALFVRVTPFIQAPLPMPMEPKKKRALEVRCRTITDTLWTDETFPEFLFPRDFFTYDEATNLAISIRGFGFAVRTMCRVTIDFLYHVFSDMYYDRNLYPVKEDAARKQAFFEHIRDVRHTVLVHKVTMRKTPPQPGPGRYTPPQKLGNLRLDVLIKAIEGCVAAREAFLRKKVGEAKGLTSGKYTDLLDAASKDNASMWFDDSDDEDIDTSEMPRGKHFKGARRQMRAQMAYKEMRRAVDQWIRFIRLGSG